MSGIQEKKFQKASKEKAFDLDHRQVMNHNLSQYSRIANESFTRFANLENAKRKAHIIKWRSMENLDKLLHEFESNFIKRGGKVIWANDASEALEEIAAIFNNAGVKRVVKSKSMVTEEIGLNSFLEKKGILSQETDLGEYIVQLLNQKPYHIVTPAMHLKKEEIAQLFHEKFDTPLDADPETITAKARMLLRDEFRTVDAGITGANFLLADTGSLVITENEGNVRLGTAFPKIHIAIAGIEKIIPSIKDLDLFLPLLSTHGTGQQLTTYNNIISGPRKEDETDGPEEMYIILLDNGRTDLLAKVEQRQGLYCIRCGACLNVCPVYQNIGGHAYGTTYSGPIGSLITPHTEGVSQFKHLSKASTLCGKCTEVCPVSINIDRMLNLNRRDVVNEKLANPTEVYVWKIITSGFNKRNLMDLFGGKLKNTFAKFFFKRKRGAHLELPKFAEKSFSAQWKKDQHQSQSL